VKKVDADPETGEGGDDEIDAWRYLVAGFAKSQSQEPRELQLRKMFAKIAAKWNGEIPGHLVSQAWDGARKMLDKEQRSQLTTGFSIPRIKRPAGTKQWLMGGNGFRIQ
jgi:hypothetical protein